MTIALAEILLLTLLGPLIGSCLGLLTLRLPAGRPVGAVRSACGGCGRKLGLLDLAPVISWLALRGRCRTCASPIPLRYPLLEVACGVIGLWSALMFDGPLAAAGAVFGWGLLLIAIIDAEHFWLPHRLTVPLLVAGLLAAASLQPESLAGRLIGAAVGWAILALLAAGYRRLRGRDGLGGGDAMMLGALGAWVGWQGLPSVLLLAALLGLVAAVTQRKFRADARMPFGTLMAPAAWIVWLYGPLGL
jgi:leader peptidase (prepilin peptidase)/N-methyltransferase